MAIISRAAWGSTGARGGSVLRGPLRDVIVHTWAMPATGRTPMSEAQAASWMRAVQAGHRGLIPDVTGILGPLGFEDVVIDPEHTGGIDPDEFDLEWSDQIIPLLPSGDVRGWSDIGYSYCIDPHGRIFEGRGWLRSGAHTQGGGNTSGHGVALMGHGDQQQATDAQWAGLRELIIEGVRVGAISSRYLITGHRDWPSGGKTCPGNLIYPGIHRLDAGSTFMEGGDEMDTSGIKGLRRGDEGAAVAELQRLLNTQGAGLTIDGDFGPATEDMLHNFQVANGLARSMVADASVMSHLRLKAGELVPPTADDVDHDETILIRRQVAGLVEHTARLIDATEAAVGQAQAVRGFASELGRLTSDWPSN